MPLLKLVPRHRHVRLLPQVTERRLAVQERCQIVLRVMVSKSETRVLEALAMPLRLACVCPAHALVALLRPGASSRTRPAPSTRAAVRKRLRTLIWQLPMLLNIVKGLRVLPLAHPLAKSSEDRGRR